MNKNIQEAWNNLQKDPLNTQYALFYLMALRRDFGESVVYKGDAWVCSKYSGDLSEMQSFVRIKEDDILGDIAKWFINYLKEETLTEMETDDFSENGTFSEISKEDVNKELAKRIDIDLLTTKIKNKKWDRENDSKYVFDKFRFKDYSFNFSVEELTLE